MGEPRISSFTFAMTVEGRQLPHMAPTLSVVGRSKPGAFDPLGVWRAPLAVDEVLAFVS